MNDKYLIRKAILNDAKRIADLESVAFGLEAASFEDFHNLIQDLDEEIYLEVLTNENSVQSVLGFTGLQLNFTESSAYIWNLLIDPEYRGRGLGQKLIEHLLNIAISKKCEIVSLEVAESNTVARSLYKKLGFVEVEMLSKYYQNGEDGIKLEIKLKQ